MRNIVEVAQELIALYEKEILLNRETNTYNPNQRLMLEGAWAGLRNADYYEIDEELCRFAEDMKEQYYNMKVTDIVLSPDCRPPSKTCFLYSHSEESEVTAVLTLQSGTSNVNVIYIPTDMQKMPFSMGHFRIDPPDDPDEGWFGFGPDVPDDADVQNVALSLILHTAMLFSLINQPRFVVRGKAGTRQLKRRMHRGYGISTDAWHKIQWNITEPVKAKDDSDRGGWRMPLHYTRGHWRKAQDHWDDVVIRKDGQPYKWIEGFWSGHPAYGVKKSYHAPKLGGTNDKKFLEKANEQA